jgi:hypothetical protein
MIQQVQQQRHIRRGRISQVAQGFRCSLAIRVFAWLKRDTSCTAWRWNGSNASAADVPECGASINDETTVMAAAVNAARNRRAKNGQTAFRG